MAVAAIWPAALVTCSCCSAVLLLAACRAPSRAPWRTAPIADLAESAPQGPHVPEPDPDRERRRWPGVGVRAGGALLGNFDTELRLSSPRLGIGTTIDFEDDLGFDSTTEVGRLGLWWRINRHHRLELSYFDIRRTSGRFLDREIEWGDETFPINTGVTAFFNTRVLKATYRYNLVASDDLELGPSLGIHGMRLDTGIRASRLELSEEFDADIPLPVLGLGAEWIAAPRLRFVASLEALHVELSGLGGLRGLNELDGTILDAVLGVEYELLDHLGLGLAYNAFYLDASFGEPLLELAGTYRYDGLLLYGVLSF